MSDGVKILFYGDEEDYKKYVQGTWMVLPSVKESASIPPFYIEYKFENNNRIFLFVRCVPEDRIWNTELETIDAAVVMVNAKDTQEALRGRCEQVRQKFGDKPIALYSEESISIPLENLGKNIQAFHLSNNNYSHVVNANGVGTIQVPKTVPPALCMIRWIESSVPSNGKSIDSSAPSNGKLCWCC
jgi:hypothetical protein